MAKNPVELELKVRHLGVATYKVGETWSDLGRSSLAGASR